MPAPTVLTNQWTQEHAKVVEECKEAKDARLCMLGAVLGKHGSYGNNSAGKDSSETSEEYHLPYGLTKTKECRGECQSEQ